MITDALWDSLPGTGWLSRPEADMLFMAAAAAEGDILEVGCYHGKSTVLLSSLGRIVHAVDPFEGFSTDDPFGFIAKRAFLANLRERGIGNVHLYHRRIEDWVPRPVGFAYLDGDHTPAGTATQIRIALAAGGRRLCVHDVNESGDGLLIKYTCLEMLGPWTERVGRIASWIL